MPRENIGTWMNRVLLIGTPEDAQRFYNNELAFLRAEHPEVTDPERVLRSNIGWCFGEGMRPNHRQMWAEVCGAEHPGLGPEFTYRDFSPEELLRAGEDLARRHLREARYPSAWDLVLRDRWVGDD